MPIAEVLSDHLYIEANTVRITVRTGQHNGKLRRHSLAFYEFVYIRGGISLFSRVFKQTIGVSPAMFRKE